MARLLIEWPIRMLDHASHRERLHAYIMLVGCRGSGLRCRTYPGGMDLVEREGEVAAIDVRGLVAGGR
jgi:hypothetical protein